MKVVALISGGKDSCYNMQLCESFGHEIVALANLLPLDDTVDELDSFMFQTVGHQVVAAYAQCMGLPLFRRRIQGSPRAKDLRYSATDGDEVEDLEVLLRAVKSRVPDLGGVSTGAIASDYQRMRVENVCSRLGLVSLAYMWKQDQASLLTNMIDSGLQAVLVKVRPGAELPYLDEHVLRNPGNTLCIVAAMGLDPHKHLGKDLATLQPVFLKLQDLYGCNVCGEGGEYESLVLDCPLFKNAKIVLDEFTVQLHSPDTIAPVGVLHPTKFHLEYKSLEPDPGLTEIPLEVTDDFVCNNDSSKIHAALLQSSLNSTGSMPNQDSSIKSKLLTKVNRQRHGFVAISCWRNGDLPNEDTQCELGVLLSEIEKNFEIEKLSWADVLYVHLYLSDMKDFSEANAIYTQHITEKESVRGVPSRCCVELPLVHAGMGRVFIEILATTDSSKKVLHVQSISSWAPCCIGPYSQATRHQQLMYMAGQLGFDPPSMNLVVGGATCEMTQALKHCRAIGEVFTQSFSNSVLSYTVYCSCSTGVKGMHDIEGVLNKYLSTEKSSVTNSQCCILPQSLVLYILLPALPKGALVEVAPLTYMSGSSQLNYDDSYEEADTASWELISKNSRADAPLGFEEFSTCKAMILPGHLCRSFTFLSYRENTTEAETLSTFPNGHVTLTRTFELILSVLAEAALSWTDVFVLRVYFVAEKISADGLREALGALVEDSLFKDVPEPTLIPVLGVGDTAELLDLIAVELTASGGS